MMHGNLFQFDEYQQQNQPEPQQQQQQPIGLDITNMGGKIMLFLPT